VTLTIAVPTTAREHPLPGPFGPAAAPIALALVLLPFSRRTRKATARWSLLLVAAALLALGASGCSGGGGGGSTPPAERTYNLTVTATAGGFSQSTSLTLNVN